MDKKHLTAPCGLDCFNCLTFEGNITEEWKKQVSKFLKIPVEETPCKGCRDEKGNCKFAVNNHCATWDCVNEKELTYCCECSDFPCEKLMPTKEGAEYPHNVKVYNLCRIKYKGIDNWIEEADDIRTRYYTGKFEVGKGPILEGK
jgi:hypothetical protein